MFLDETYLILMIETFKNMYIPIPMESSNFPLETPLKSPWNPLEIPLNFYKSKFPLAPMWDWMCLTKMSTDYYTVIVKVYNKTLFLARQIRALCDMHVVKTIFFILIALGNIILFEVLFQNIDVVFHWSQNVGCLLLFRVKCVCCIGRWTKLKCPLFLGLFFFSFCLGPILAHRLHKATCKCHDVFCSCFRVDFCCYSRMAGQRDSSRTESSMESISTCRHVHLFGLC
jgi:hypothetical protein